MLFAVIAISAITIGLVLARPKPLNEGTAAALGAMMIVAVGIVSFRDAWDVLRGTYNILLFFLGLMVISGVADQAGFFRWCAHEAVVLAHGSARGLLLVVFGLGVLITALFSNDATALVLTPVVFVLVTRFGLKPLPYVFACAFIANTASMLLPVSNPVNLLAVDQFDITLGEYLKFTLLPGVIAIAVNIGLFVVIFRRDISGSFDDQGREDPVKADTYFLFVCAGLGLTAIGYIVASVYAMPVSWAAMGGAGFLLLGGFIFRRLRWRGVASGVSGTIFLFIFGLALLVRGLENQGITAHIGEALAHLSSASTFWAIILLCFGTAMVANLVNNWTMMMIATSSLASVGAASGALDRGLIFASILGADLGPNLTILGSLSSMLWLLLLRQRGLEIRPMQYVKLGLTVTPLMILTGALSIYLCHWLFG